jgi:hypothetical protein
VRRRERRRYTSVVVEYTPSDDRADDDKLQREIALAMFLFMSQLVLSLTKTWNPRRVCLQGEGRGQHGFHT